MECSIYTYMYARRSHGYSLDNKQYYKLVQNLHRFVYIVVITEEVVNNKVTRPRIAR